MRNLAILLGIALANALPTNSPIAQTITRVSLGNGGSELPANSENTNVFDALALNHAVGGIGTTAFQSLTEASLIDSTAIVDVNQNLDVFASIGSMSFLISRTVPGLFPTNTGDSISYDPTTSEDGTRIAFTSLAKDLDPNFVFTANLTRIYMFDIVSFGNTFIAQGLHPAFSADGSTLAFESDADLAPNDFDGGLADIYLFDTATSTFTLASAPPTHFDIEFRVHAPHDFQDWPIRRLRDHERSEPPRYQRTTDVYLFDRVTGVTEIVSLTNRDRAPRVATSTHGSVSDDGRFVAFTSDAKNMLTGVLLSGINNIYVRDRLLGTTTLVSHAFGSTTAEGSSPSEFAVISGSASHIAFHSAASNLAPGVPSTGTEQVYRYNRLTGNNIVVSQVAGTLGDAQSIHPSISENGKEITFSSSATNLLGPGGDTNGVRDVYLAIYP